MLFDHSNGTTSSNLNNYLHTRAINAIDAIQALVYSWLMAIDYVSSSGQLTAEEVLELMYQPIDYKEKKGSLIDTVAYFLNNFTDPSGGFTVRYYVRINLYACIIIIRDIPNTITAARKVT